MLWQAFSLRMSRSPSLKGWHTIARGETPGYDSRAPRPNDGYSRKTSRVRARASTAAASPTAPAVTATAVA